MIAGVVERVGVYGRGVDGVAEDLNDFPLWFGERCAVAEGGAAAIYSKGGGGGEEGEGGQEDGEEGDGFGGGWGMHCVDLLMDRWLGFG